jgi:hypothetical protein
MRLAESDAAIAEICKAVQQQLKIIDNSPIALTKVSNVSDAEFSDNIAAV